MPLRPLGDSLSNWSNRREFSRRLAAATVVNAANDVGAGRFRAASFRGGTLLVEIPSASVRYLLQPEVPVIITAINTKLGRHVVEAIKFRLYRSE